MKEMGKYITVDQCLAQLDLLEFQDAQGHPLKNSVAFIELVELAKKGQSFTVSTFRTFDEYKECYSRCFSGQNPNTADYFGTIPIGKFSGDIADIRAYLESKKIGDLCIIPSETAEKITKVTREMAALEAERFSMVEELKAKLAELEGKKP